MKTRSNPVGDLYARLREAMEEGVRGVALRGDGSAKVFQPIDPAKLGTVAQELDLVRMCAGEFVRTGKTYEAADIRMIPFLCFAYASERFCRVSGDNSSADIWKFIRSIPKKASKAMNGYLQKGGVSRVLLSARTLGVGPVHCVPEQLQISEPRDTLVFARSDLWPVETGAGRDGWNKMCIDVINGCWRGDEVDLDRNILLAGMNISVVQPLHQFDFSRMIMRGIMAKSSEMRGSDFRDCDLTSAVFVSCKLSGSDFRGAKMDGVKMLYCDISFTQMDNDSLSTVDFSGSTTSSNAPPGWTAMSGKMFTGVLRRK